MRTRAILPLILFLAGDCAIRAQQAVWALADCQREALLQSRDLASMQARLQAARATARQAGRWGNPEFSATSLSNERNLSLVQEFDLWGKRTSAIRVAEADAAAMSASRSVVEREVLEEVARYYWKLAAAQGLVGLHMEELEAWTRFVAIRQQEVELGAFAHADMLVLRETAAEREQGLRQARLEGGTARAALNSLLGRRPDEPLTVAGALPGDGQPSVEDLLTAALETDPIARTARARAVAAGYRIEQKARNWRPNPRFGPAAKEENGRWSAGVQAGLSIPIWDRQRDGLRALEAGKEQAGAEVEAAEILAVQRAYRVYLKSVALAEASAHYETMILQPAEERLRQVAGAFEAGDLSKREVLAVRLEWLRRKQHAEILRYRRAEAAALMDLVMRPSPSDVGQADR